jgi:hypothetical protein
MSDYDKQRMERIRAKIDNDDREWLEDYIRRREAKATAREFDRVNNHYQTQLQGRPVVVRRQRDGRDIVEKVTDFVFGED